LFMVYALVAIGLNLLVGFTGQISLGHAGFFATGAYTLGFLITLKVPFVLALIAAALVSALLGYLVGIPALKLEGPYLAIATSGFGLAMQQIVANTPAFGGHSGLILEKPVILGINFARDRDYCWSWRSRWSLPPLTWLVRTLVGPSLRCAMPNSRRKPPA
jgi:branched-chain amino acid transport system permease protein